MVTEFPQNFPHIAFSSTPSLQCPTKTNYDGDSVLFFGIAVFIRCKALNSQNNEHHLQS